MGQTDSTLPYGTGDNRRQAGMMPLKGAVGARPPGGFQQPSWGNAGSGSSGVANTRGTRGTPTFSGQIPEDVRRRIQQAVAGRQQGGPAGGGFEPGPSGMPGFGPGGRNDLGGGGGWMKPPSPKPGPDVMPSQPGGLPNIGSTNMPLKPQVSTYTPPGGTGPKDQQGGDPTARGAQKQPVRQPPISRPWTPDVAEYQDPGQQKQPAGQPGWSPGVSV